MKLTHQFIVSTGEPRRGRLAAIVVLAAAVAAAGCWLWASARRRGRGRSREILGDADSSPPAAVEPRLNVNGRAVEASPDHPLLLDVLREQLRLTGAKRSCDFQLCGACTVLVDGTPVSSCCFLTADADGRQVETIEGFAQSPDFDEIAAVFIRRNTFQCGYCAPGYLMTLKSLLEAAELRDRQDVVEALAGNFCRCTGYRAIIDAVCEIAGIEDASSTDEEHR